MPATRSPVIAFGLFLALAVAALHPRAEAADVDRAVSRAFLTLLVGEEAELAGAMECASPHPGTTRLLVRLVRRLPAHPLGTVATGVAVAAGRRARGEAGDDGCASVGKARSGTDARRPGRW